MKIKRFLHREATKNIKVMTSDIFSITPELHRLRHDPEKLANIFNKLLK
jgi:hypothetical protein